VMTLISFVFRRFAHILMQRRIESN